MDQQVSQATELGLDIRPMTGYTGAEIFGVDLTKPLDPAVTAEIRAALLQWKVVFFRDQFIDREQHLALACAFGEPLPGHPTFPPSFPDYPEILLLDNQQGTAKVKE
jgi:taurine dioxygenase